MQATHVRGSLYCCKLALSQLVPLWKEDQKRGSSNYLCLVCIFGFAKTSRIIFSKNIAEFTTVICTAYHCPVVHHNNSEKPNLLHSKVVEYYDSKKTNHFAFRSIWRCCVFDHFSLSLLCTSAYPPKLTAVAKHLAAARLILRCQALEQIFQEQTWAL